MNDCVTSRRFRSASEVVGIVVRLLENDERWRQVSGQRSSRQDRVSNRKTVRGGGTCK
jgi:hypothetical protein